MRKSNNDVRDGQRRFIGSLFSCALIGSQASHCSMLPRKKNVPKWRQKKIGGNMEHRSDNNIAKANRQKTPTTIVMCGKRKTAIGTWKRRSGIEEVIAQLPIDFLGSWNWFFCSMQVLSLIRLHSLPLHTTFHLKSWRWLAQFNRFCFSVNLRTYKSSAEFFFWRLFDTHLTFAYICQQGTANEWCMKRSVTIRNMLRYTLLEATQRRRPLCKYFSFKMWISSNIRIVWWLDRFSCRKHCPHNQSIRIPCRTPNANQSSS